jgi:hypothetical protein
VNRDESAALARIEERVNWIVDTLKDHAPRLRKVEGSISWLWGIGTALVFILGIVKVFAQ